MIEDLPAPRATSNILARTLVILFGRGYVLVGIAAAVFVSSHVLFWLKAHHQPVDWMHLTAPSLREIALGFVVQMLFVCLAAIVIVIVAFGARNILDDLPIDLRESFGAVRERWLSLFGVTFIWVLASEAIFDIYLLPRGQALEWWFDHIGPFYPVIVALSLIRLGTAWSVLDIVFTSSGVARAFVNGLVVPWKLGLRSLLVVPAFIARPFLQSWMDDVAANALSKAPAILTPVALGLIAALLLTFLAILLAVAFLEHQEQSTRSRLTQAAASPG